ncbi:MAG TPA: hypothetical protein VHA37_08880 [Candidatus Saccharimonadales bacterium]|nr:hypothetical protein [Candidatus Saccharimonadales bacterium]
MTRYEDLRRNRLAASDGLKRVAERRENFRHAFVAGLADYLGCPVDSVRAEFTEVREELDFLVRLDLGTEWAPLILQLSFPIGKVVVSDDEAGVHFRVWESDLERGLQPVFAHVVDRLAQWARSNAVARAADHRGN